MNTSRVKRHRHGYRGYGSALYRENGGAIHWGRGFGGVDFPGGAGILPPRHDVVPQELHERLPPEDDTEDPSDS